MTNSLNKNSIRFEDYEIKIIHKNNYFYLKIDELSLMVKSKKLETGFELIKKRFLDITSIYKDSNQEHSLPQPRKTIQKNHLHYELKVFIYKFLIIGVTIVLISVFSTTFLAFKLKQTSPTDIFKTEVRKLINTVNAKLPKEEEAKKAQFEKFKSFIIEIKPYLDELNSIK